MKKILVVSGKGGTGKTTFSSSLIHYLGAKAFCDCDVDAPNLHLLQRFDSTPETFSFIGGKKAVINKEKCIGCNKCYENCRFSAIKNIDGKCEICDTFCEGCGVCKYVCPVNAIEMTPDIAGEIHLYKEDSTFSTANLKMGRGNSGKLVMEVKKTLFNNVDNEEIAVLDGSPGVGCPVISALSGVNFAIIVTEPTLSGKSDLIRVYKTIKMCGVKCGVLINKYDINRDLSEEIKQFAEKENIQFLGVVPYDKSALKAINSGKSLIEMDSVGASAIKKACEKVKNIIGE